MGAAGPRSGAWPAPLCGDAARTRGASLRAVAHTAGTGAEGIHRKADAPRAYAGFARYGRACYPGAFAPRRRSDMTLRCAHRRAAKALPAGLSAAFLTVVLALAGCTSSEPVAAPGAPPTGAPAADEHVVLHLETGDVTIDLFEKEAPQHAANFKKLVREGFYNGLTFHRVTEAGDQGRDLPTPKGGVGSVYNAFAKPWESEPKHGIALRTANPPYIEKLTKLGWEPWQVTFTPEVGTPPKVPWPDRGNASLAAAWVDPHVGPGVVPGTWVNEADKVLHATKESAAEIVDKVNKAGRGQLEKWGESAGKAGRKAAPALDLLKPLIYGGIGLGAGWLALQIVRSYKGK